MSNHRKAPKESLENLHGALAEALAAKIKSGDATAADLAVARQFLKDNGIDSIGEQNPDLGKLRDQLPFDPSQEQET